MDQVEFQLFLSNFRVIHYLCRVKEMLQGNGCRSLVFYLNPSEMEKEILLEKVQDWTEEIIGPEAEYFLVSAKIKPTNNIKLYLDGDNGINIDKCIQINRALRTKIDESGIFPEGDFSLEVSSPGIDEPLKSLRQYRKNTGRLVEVTFLNEDEKPKTGKLVAVEDSGITIEETTGKGKKAVVHNVDIAFDQIKKTIVQIQF